MPVYKYSVTDKILKHRIDDLEKEVKILKEYMEDMESIEAGVMEELKELSISVGNLNKITSVLQKDGEV